jgi:hypothetical protein
MADGSGLCELELEDQSVWVVGAEDVEGDFGRIYGVCGRKGAFYLDFGSFLGKKGRHHGFSPVVGCGTAAI